MEALYTIDLVRHLLLSGHSDFSAVARHPVGVGGWVY